MAIYAVYYRTDVECRMSLAEGTIPEIMKMMHMTFAEVFLIRHPGVDNRKPAYRLKYKGIKE